MVTAVNTDLVESAPSDEATGTPAPVPPPPNFLFIIADDMDTYSINAYRNSEPAELTTGGTPYVIDTPNIDRLAAEGMLFHQARLMGADAGAVCRPSRTTIMSGKNTWQRTQGVSAPVTFPGIFNRGARTGTTALPHATYRTCKNGNSYPTANGEFTIVNDATRRGNTDGNGSEWHADRALEHLAHWQVNHRATQTPFLIYLGFSHPHDTRNARTTPHLTNRYGCLNTNNPGTLVLNPNAPPLPTSHLPVDEALGIPANYPFHPFDFGHLNVRDENTVNGIDRYRTEAVVRNEIGRNFACVDWIDRQLGRVFARLEDPDGNGDASDSVLDNTYIVFTSDHGIAIGRHGLQGKQNLYEHTWRVPYIVRGPGIAPGSETEALIYLHDTFPTFCDLAGIDLPATLDGNDGRSFRAVLEGTSTTHRDVLYGLYAGGSRPGMRAVTDGRFKLIKYDVGGNTTQETQLFDLQENPFELLPEHGVPDLAERTAYAGIRQRLEELLMEQRIENADPDAFLGDRTLLRFEDGAAGLPAGSLADRLPFGNDGTAASGAGGLPPSFSADVPAGADSVLGEPNTLSLRFNQDDESYVELADDRTLDFGGNPFTIEAWVKLETLPTGNDDASRMPVVMKKVIGAADSELDYMFLAAAGSYGGPTDFDKLALLRGDTAILSTLSIPDTNWHHISVAIDPVAGVYRFTMDGQEDSGISTAVGTLNNGPVIIGAHFNSSGVIDGAFDGLIDELSITDGFLGPGGLQPLQGIPVPGPFRITSVQDNGNGTANLRFESNEQFLYDLEQSTSLQADSWRKVRTFIGGAPGANETTFASVPKPAFDRGFFRVVCYPPTGP